MDFRTSRTLSNRAFSLMELLVTISIIIILAALVFPASEKIVKQAKASQTASNLKQIFIASESWSSENNGRIVPVYMPGEGDAKSLRNWTGLLAPYLGRTSTNPFESAAEVPVYVDVLHPKRFGFGYNYAYLSWVKTSSNIERWVMRGAIASPAETVFLTTVNNGQTKTDDFMTWRSYVRPPSLSKNFPDYVVSFDHPGNTALVLWVDGHISAETSGTLMKDDSLWDRD